MTGEWHKPVMLKEAVESLKCKSNGVYVDATVGGGGYAEAILEATNPNGRLIALDRDKDALDEAARRLKKFSGRVVFCNTAFGNLAEELRKFGEEKVDGVVADLGVSSHQLNTTGRGFSFLRDAPLDMRMDASSDVTAENIVNEWSEKKLADMFFEYGEERKSRRIARNIAEKRKEARITTTGELAELVRTAFSPAARHGRLHPATKVFQALRIAVNDELGQLVRLTGEAPFLLRETGRIVVVSYHSLEDRIVKRAFLKLSKTAEFKIVTKKPQQPSREEVMKNRRARSAKMRVLEKI